MNRKRDRFLIFMGFIVIFLLPAWLYAQTTGKIAGEVLDLNTGEPLIGANVILAGTQLGAATGMDGSFFMINVPPGSYTVKIFMMGYKTFILNKVTVSVNRTYEITAKLEPAILEGQEVVVTAAAVEIKKDQTSSTRNVSAADIEKLPVENLEQVVNMQAGVVAGHFRGGRNTEVSYLIDGIQVDDSFLGLDGAGNPIAARQSVNLEAESIQDLEVITGTFNAEYGRAMSGIVNAVTKEGGSNFSGSFSGSYANFLSSNDDIFIGLNSGNFGLNLSQDYKFQLMGPVFKDKLTFFINCRYQDWNGHLNGIRRFNPWDYSDYTSADSSEWHIENTGDNQNVSMEHGLNLSVLGKLTFKPFNNLKITALHSLNDEESQNYSHYYKYNPDGRGFNFHASHMSALTLNHTLTPSLFYEFKVSYVDNRYDAYTFEDPLDKQYLHPRYSGTGQCGFATGGIASSGSETAQSISQYNDTNYKFDLTWQATRHHSLKTGAIFIRHHINKDAVNVRNKWAGLSLENVSVVDATGKIDWPFYEREIIPHTENTMDVYEVDPYEFAGYLQDKLEFDELVLNIGIRYEYFNSDQIYPTDRRNPSNQLNLPDSMMTSYESAKPQTQISPRLGLAYQLSDVAVLHFSYGHFFQMPPMYALYANNIFRVPVDDFSTTMGNAELFPQKTISYEIGIWQQLLPGMGLELALFYKDIYDLLSTQIISTYNQIEYGLYTNKDYGNARGLEIKWDFVQRNFTAFVNYTLQYTKGNADNPRQTFTRAGSSMDPIKRLIPMSWDQRHTFNATVGYHINNYGVTLTGYYNSGTPYTFSPMTESPLSLVNLYMNNDYQPAGYKVDLTAFYDVALTGKYKARLTLNIYNLLDNLNAADVYGSTGQPYTTIVRAAQIAQHRSNFNDFFDRVENPTMYSAPRQIKLGLGISF